MRAVRLRLRLPGAAVGDHADGDLRARARQPHRRHRASSTSPSSRASRAARPTWSGRASTCWPRARPARAPWRITHRPRAAQHRHGADRAGDDPLRASPSSPRRRCRYLGLGTQPPQPSWGRMLNEAQTLLFQAPRLAVFPGVAIVLAVLGRTCSATACATCSTPGWRGSDEQTMTIDFVSDVACPWCAVGLAALERALQTLGGEIAVELHFQPFELNPTMAPEGADAAEYLIAKYGISARAAGRRTARACAERGAARRLRIRRAQRMSGTPSTRTGCCTGPGSRARRQPAALKRRCCRPITARARNPGAHDVLLSLASKAGLDFERAARCVAGDDATPTRCARPSGCWQQAGHPLGAGGGRSTDRHLISGGQPPEVFVQALRQLAAEVVRVARIARPGSRRPRTTRLPRISRCTASQQGSGGISSIGSSGTHARPVRAAL